MAHATILPFPVRAGVPESNPDPRPVGDPPVETTPTATYWHRLQSLRAELADLRGTG